MINVFSSKRFVDVKAAFNDACLRFGKENINSYNLIQSALLIEENISPNLLENMDKYIGKKIKFYLHNNDNLLYD